MPKARHWWPAGTGCLAGRGQGRAGATRDEAAQEGPRPRTQSENMRGEVSPTSEWRPGLVKFQRAMGFVIRGPHPPARRPICNVTPINQPPASQCQPSNASDRHHGALSFLFQSSTVSIVSALFYVLARNRKMCVFKFWTALQPGQLFFFLEK